MRTFFWPTTVKVVVMLSNIFVKSIRDLRKSTIWWSFGLVSLTLLTQLFYPSVSSMTEFNELLTDDSLIKAFLGDVPDLTSPAGYLNSQLFFHDDTIGLHCFLDISR